MLLQFTLNMWKVADKNICRDSSYLVLLCLTNLLYRYISTTVRRKVLVGISIGSERICSTMLAGNLENLKEVLSGEKELCTTIASTFFTPTPK